VHAILLTQLATTWFMVGLIWIVQIVHYPLFAHVGQEQFALYANKHQLLITFIVGPVMVAEILTAIVLAWYPPSADTAIWLRLGLVMVMAAWVSTALIQVPQHSRLTESGFDLSTIQALVNWNWIRTIAWTVRGAILLFVLSRLLRNSNLFV